MIDQRYIKIIESHWRLLFFLKEGVALEAVKLCHMCATSSSFPPFRLRRQGYRIEYDCELHMM